jgi:hypothetical protein
MNLHRTAISRSQKHRIDSAPCEASISHPKFQALKKNLRGAGCHQRPPKPHKRVINPARSERSCASELTAQSGWLDLNQRPPAPKAGALPSCATPRLLCSSHAKLLPNLAHAWDNMPSHPSGRTNHQIQLEPFPSDEPAQ